MNIRLILACALCATLVQADDGGDKGAESPRDVLRKLVARGVENYQVHASIDELDALTPKIAISWVNETRLSSGGVMALCLQGTRPLAAMHVYDYNGNLCHEIDTLSRKKICARKQGALVWQPDAVLEFRPVPKAPVPADTALGRLKQMKSLSAQFTGMLTGWDTAAPRREVLRLLPKELHRYADSADGVIDGAVYTFAQGTDPEVLLLLEAVRKSDGSAGWMYGLTRATSAGLEVRHDGTLVWTVASTVTVQTADNKSAHFGTSAPLEIPASTADKE